MSLARTRGLAGAALGCAAWWGAAACSTEEAKYVDEPIPDASFDTRPTADSGLGILAFRPHEAFSGHDGTHTFIVPLAVYDSSDDLVVAADDPTAADVVAKELVTKTREDGTTDSGKYFFVTVKRAGAIAVTASSGGKTVRATIEVASYGAARWAAGEARYKNGGSGNPPCADCHVNGQAIDHSPAALATATDEEIAIVITTGISTGGFPILINGQPGHTWTVTDAERDGLVTYLRSLTPRGFE